MASFLFGSVWQRIVLILLVCTLVRAQEGAAGEADSEDPVRAGDVDSAFLEERGTVCKDVGAAMDNNIRRSPEFYADWPLGDRDALGKLFSLSKARTPHHSTVCVGMNATCCTPEAEKLLLKTTRLDFKNVYHSVLQEHFSECSNTARHLYHALYEKFVESHRLLEAEISEKVPNILPDGVFEELFKYITTFIHRPNFCPLREHVQALVQELTQSVYLAQLKDEEDIDADPQKLECLRNVSSPFIQEPMEEISISLERLLSDVALFVESIDIVEKITDTVKRHSFSTPCVYALTRLKYCAICGAHTEFPACLNFCLNVFRGCLADVAELYDNFAEFHELLKEFFDRLVNELQPQIILESSLHKIVALVEMLKKQNLVTLVSAECEIPQVIRRKRNSLQTSIPQTSTPVITTTVYTDVDIALDPLPNAMAGQLSCLEDLEILLDSLPDEMCYLSKNHVGSSRNDHCWTGTGLGRYEDRPIGKSKAEQVNNPAFPRSSMETDLLYMKQIQKLAELTERINASMQLKLCLENQQADCGPPQVLCTKPEVVIPVCTGSGCGSGADESSSGLGDIEEGDEDKSENAEDINRPNSNVFEDKWTPDPNVDETDLTDPIVILSDADDYQDQNSTDDNSTDPIVDDIADTKPTFIDDSVTNPIVIIDDDEAEDYRSEDFTSNSQPPSSNSHSVHPFHHLLLWGWASLALCFL